MLVWSLSVTVSYVDGSWSGTEYTYHRGNLIIKGPDVSSFTEVKTLWTALGFRAKSDPPSRTDIKDVVFRFMSIYTDAYINVLGTTDDLDILSNNSQVVINALQNNPEFSNGFLNQSCALLFSKDSISDSNTYPQSVTADDNAQYTLSPFNSQSNVVIIRKIRGDNIIWSTALTSDGNNIPNRIKINPVDGKLYVIVIGGMFKIDPEDGSVIWSYFNLNQTVEHSFISLGFKTNGDLVTLGTANIDDNHAFLLATWSRTDATKISEHYLNLVEPTNTYIQGEIFVDKENNVIMPLDYYTNDYGTLLVKWSLTTNQVVWQFNIFASYFNGYDQDCVSSGIDSQGNVYVNGYGRGLTKISKDGQLVWARLVDRYLPGLGVFANGDCILYGDGNDDLLITKISYDGSYEWSTSIVPNTHIQSGGWVFDANSKAQVINDNLYLMAQYDADGTQELILKLGSDQFGGTVHQDIALSTFELIFNDATDSITVEVVEPSNDNLTLNHQSTNYLAQAQINPQLVAVVQTLTRIDIG